MIVRPVFFCHSSAEIGIASSEGNSRLRVVGEKVVSYLHMFEGLYKIIVSEEDFDAYLV